MGVTEAHNHAAHRRACALPSFVSGLSTGDDVLVDVTTHLLTPTLLAGNPPPRLSNSAG